MNLCLFRIIERRSINKLKNMLYGQFRITGTFRRCICVCPQLEISKRLLKLHPSDASALRQLCTISSMSNEDRLTDVEYEKKVDETLDSLTELFEDLPEQVPCDKDYDVEFASGVLTVRISQIWGTYVINKQTPNKQIWLSSPLSGPKRYNFIKGQWIYRHENSTLHDLLQSEISKALKQTIDFSKCSYSHHRK